MSKIRRLKRAVIKEELVALTGDMEQAVILNQFIYWSERINEFDKFIEEEKQRAALGPDAEKELEDDDMDQLKQRGWIYKSISELKDEIMFTASETTLGRRLDDLLKGGWIERRRNPKYAWDKVYQYRVNLNKIAVELFELGYFLDGYKYNVAELLKLSESKDDVDEETQDENSNPQIEDTDVQDEELIPQVGAFNPQSGGAIPEITSETTLDIDLSIEETDRIIDTWTKELGQVVLPTLDILNGIKLLIKEYGINYILAAINEIKNSDYLMGITTGQKIKLDWFVKKENFIKVLNGNYRNKKEQSPKHKKTKFHNFEQRSDNYTGDELEEVARKKREEYDRKIEEENRRLRERRG